MAYGCGCGGGGGGGGDGGGADAAAAADDDDNLKIITEAQTYPVQSAQSLIHV